MPAERLPDWLRVRHSPSSSAAHGVLRGRRLNTVCEEARCPNRTECFSRPTAAFLILGPSCTRRCGFCSVDKGATTPPDPGEPMRVAEAAREMGLRYVVVTSVTRDDLPDGGASHFVSTIRAIREAMPGARVEVLVPDFGGDGAALAAVLGAAPDVLNHNVETVPRLYGRVRPGAEYGRSLALLSRASAHFGSARVKSGLMLGLGESYDEIVRVLHDLLMAGCGLLTVGQYMRPGRGSLPVAEYVRPEVFDRVAEEARAMGFIHVASGPLVRSSMNADEMYIKSRSVN